MTDVIDVDPRRCPLCGGPNSCGVVQETGTCWCFTTDVPEDVRARVPAGARDLACVCRACAEGRPDAAVAPAPDDAAQAAAVGTEVAPPPLPSRAGS